MRDLPIGGEAPFEKRLNDIERKLDAALTIAVEEAGMKLDMFGKVDG